MKVYHGATDIIQNPLVNVGRAGLDFGLGFYVTNNQTQAIDWAKRVSDRRAQAPILNEYELDYNSVLEIYRCKIFEHYNKEWLDFIATNRRQGNGWVLFDFIEGGIANDRVVDTVESYISELISSEEALKRLIFQKPNNQICILNQEIIDKYLCFITAIKL